MRELLLAFVIALIVGSVINGMQQKPNNPGQNPGQGSSSAPPADTNNPNETTSMTGNRDFPDFASFPSVDKDNFEQVVLKSQKPVFIDCYVPHNQACDQMLPLVAAVGKNHESSVTMAKLNVMDNVVLVHRYEIGNVPTFLLFDQGNLKGKLSGVLPQDRLESLLATTLHQGDGR